MPKSPYEGEPVLRMETIEQYSKRKTNLLERLATAYLEEAPQFQSRILAGMDADDLGSVKLNSHALKSCCYNLGASQLAKLSQDIEAAASSSDRLRLEILMEHLGPCCFAAEEAIRGAVFKYTGKPIAHPHVQAEVAASH